ncbi:transposase [Polystyrenella longa]|uniref:transposase n=1 Tax=Polystyrenella longa TaxID=2528007 RepID=UPI0011A67809|nr:transposase [Polystyrenella longa]
MKLIETLLDHSVVPYREPERLLYDKIADSDPLRHRLFRWRGIELVTPHKKNRKKKPTQDGRSFRRYRKRWRVERTISWLKNFRRLVVRYDYYAHLYHSFVQLACLIFILKRI